jgi:hypothetical protein
MVSLPIVPKSKDPLSNSNPSTMLNLAKMGVMCGTTLTQPLLMDVNMVVIQSFAQALEQQGINVAFDPQRREANHQV